jgi:hypothetical protein
MSKLCGMLKNTFVRLNLIGHFWPIVAPFADRGLSRRLTWSASGDERGTKRGIPPAPQTDEEEACMYQKIEK